MENAGYVALSNAMATRRALDVTANNIANSDTPGFRAAKAVFEAHLAPSTERDGASVSFVRDGGVTLDPTPGGVTRTGGMLDLAIDGDGWFAMRRQDGTVGFTRNGTLLRDAEGVVRAPSGAALLDAGGAPLVLPQAADLSVGRDGTVSDARGAAIGRVGVFAVETPEALSRGPDGLLLDARAAEALRPAKGGVIQGAIESSNVNPITEMTRMIEAHRAHDRAVTVMEKDGTMTEQVLRKVGGPR